MVEIPKVISRSLVWDFLVKVPIALKATVPPVGTLPGSIDVLVADARGVNVGVTVFLGVGDFVGAGVIDGVGEGGAPVEITIASSAKPGVGLAVEVPLPLLLQLSRIAPKTNNTTGPTTSHLSHRDNIKPTPMTEGSVRCQVDARFCSSEGARKAGCNH